MNCICGECIACMHEKYGCLVCGDETGRCTPTHCVEEDDE